MIPDGGRTAQTGRLTWMSRPTLCDERNGCRSAQAPGRGPGTQPCQRDPEVGIGFLRSGPGPQQQVVIDFIDLYKSEYGVGTMCRVLSEHGCSIASSISYEARNRAASRQALRDEELKIGVSRVQAENYSV